MGYFSKFFPTLLVVALFGCDAPLDGEQVTDGVAETAMITSPLLSGNRGICPNADVASENVDYVRDLGFHYTRAPLNANPGVGSYAMPWESRFLFQNWKAYPVGGGPAVDIRAYRAYIALYFPFPFPPFTSGPSWIKILLVNMVGPDNVQHQSVFLEGGEFTEGSSGYDLRMNNPFTLAEVARSTKSSDGTNVDEIDMGNALLNPQPGFSFNSVTTRIHPPSFPFRDGKGDYRDAVTGQLYATGFYWADQFLGTGAFVEYGGNPYFAVGTAWEDAQWSGIGGQFGEDVVNWDWVSVQILGCLDSQGNKQLTCSVPLTSLGAFKIKSTLTGNSLIHSLDGYIGCEEVNLDEVGEWDLEPSGSWISPITGIDFSTGLHLTAPSKHIDLTFEALFPEQEVFTLSDRSWEGAGNVTGTINGQRVYGKGFYEQYHRPLPE